MPSASSAKLVKQASTEAPDPLRQAIIIIEHKIRNLEKRKGKLDAYRALQAEGKDLQPEQLAAVAKYEEVIQTLEFARDLCKQFNSISADSAKLAKKQARKEALERQANDLSRIKEVLLIQNALNNIGTDAVREDFLSGQNGAVQLSDTDLQLFDTFYETVTPKVYEDAKSSVDEQIAAAADHYLCAIDGKSKEFGGVTYAVFKEKISAVHACGYFDKPAVEPVSETPVEEVEVAVDGELKAEIPVEEPIPVPEVVNPTFQAPPEAIIPVHAPHQIQAQPPVPVPIRPHDVINSVTSGSFNFLQDSELDSPDPTIPPPAHPIPSAIPTQTFTNQTFVPPQVPPPASAVPMFHPQQHQPPPHMQPVHQLPGENFNAANPQASLPIPPQSHLAPVSPNAGNPVMYQQQMYSPDRYDQPRNDHVNDNHAVESQPDQNSLPAQQNAVNNKWSTETDDWNNQNSNDDWNNQQGNQNEWSNNANNNDGGYQTQRNNRDRGDREQRGRGKPRGQYNGFGGRGRGGSGGDRPYQNDRPYFRNNNSEGNNFYQNGYNKDGQGGGYRGRGGADRPRPNRGGMDRGGPRGAPRGNSRGRGGGYRGGQTGGQGQGIPSGGAGPKQ